MVQEQRELHEAQVEAIDIPPGLPVSLQVALKYQDAELALAAYRLEVGHPERQARQIRKVDVTHVETAEGHDKTITSTTVNRILAGMIPGESYTMNELSERVGVSPSTVGYAFKVAVADGRVRQAGARKPPGMKGKASRMFQLAT